jgi:hypothetical protein
MAKVYICSGSSGHANFILIVDKRGTSTSKLQSSLQMNLGGITIKGCGVLYRVLQTIMGCLQKYLEK